MTATVSPGCKAVELDADVPGFGIGKYDPDQMANIIGFLHMVDMYWITYDSANKDAFREHTKSVLLSL